MPAATSRLPFVSAWATALGLTLVTSTAFADQIGPYSVRSLTLGRGTFRIDGGAPDFGYFHPGSPQWINENRGLRVRSGDGGDAVFLGVGLAYGATDDIELGGLVFPLRLEPDGGIDDAELYSRFRLLDGGFELGAQVTLQLPTYTEFGLGLGMPMLAHTRGRLRIDTGFEFEILFWEDAEGDSDPVVMLDGPLAFTWDVGRVGFLGLRTGIYVPELERVVVPAGIHGGVVAARGRLDVSGWFMWPDFLGSDRDDPVEAGVFEVGFGINGRI